MKFQTLSVVAGTKHCQAKCPFCVSHMTGLDIAGSKPKPIHERNMLKTLKLAELAKVSTAIITSKGEPTLFPGQIDKYLSYFKDQFPFVELQTNGITIASGDIPNSTLKFWYDWGLTTILISNVGHDQELNRKTYMPKSDSYFDTQKLIDKLHDIGFSVRMTCVGIKGGVDCLEKFQEYLEYCKFIGADQVTWRPVAIPDISESKEVYDWTCKNLVDDSYDNHNRTSINLWVNKVGKLIRTLVHGGVIYDVDGQNVCLTDCLTHDPNEEEIRQLIFYPSGELYTDWQYKGSRLL